MSSTVGRTGAEAMIREYEKALVRSKKVLRVILIPIIVILILLLLVRLGLGLGGEVILPVKTVQIYGNIHVPKGEIAELIRLDSNPSMVFFNVEKARKQIFLDERVEHVEIAKVYPDTLKIYIAEKPQSAVLIEGGKAYWMSADGTILAESNEQSYSDYPLITLLSDNDDIKIGHRTGNLMVLNILSAIHQFQRSYPDFYHRIEYFSVDDTGVTVWLEGMNYRIYMGSTVTSQKLSRLRALILVLQNREDEEASGENPIEIDMSFSHAAVRKGETQDEL